MEDKKMILVGALISIAMIGFGVFHLFRYFSLRFRCKISTDAVVDDYKVHRYENSKGRTQKEYTPIIHFTANNGKQYKLEAREKSFSNRRYSPGNEIEIFYDENNPEYFFIRGNIWGLVEGIGTFLVGAMFAAMLIFIAVFR